MNKKAYSIDIANEIGTFLDEDNWNFSFDEEKGYFRFSLRMDNKIKKINYVLYVQNDAFTVYSVCPIYADDDNMLTMAEFVCRANRGLPNGNFELDMSDGEIRYKTYVDCKGVIPTQKMIKNSIYCHPKMFEHYGDGIVSVIFNDISAEEAIDRCEKDPKSVIAYMLADLKEEYPHEDLESLVDRLAANLGIPFNDDKNEDSE